MSKDPEDPSSVLIHMPVNMSPVREPVTTTPARQRNRAIISEVKYDLEQLSALLAELRHLMADTVRDPKTSAKIRLLRLSSASKTRTLVAQLLVLQSDSIEADKLKLNQLDVKYLENGKLTANATERMRIYVENFLERTASVD